MTTSTERDLVVLKSKFIYESIALITYWLVIYLINVIQKNIDNLY